MKTWLDAFIDQTMQPDGMTTVDGTTMKMLVEKIIARDTGIEVVFKCGVRIENEYVKKTMGLKKTQPYFAEWASVRFFRFPGCRIFGGWI